MDSLLAILHGNILSTWILTKQITSATSRGQWVSSRASKAKLPIATPNGLPAVEFYIGAVKVHFMSSPLTPLVSSAGLLLYHQTPWLCQSQTWALPSFSISSLTLPWPTLSSNTCACWTSTPNPPPRATPASSAPSVCPHHCLPHQSSGITSSTANEPQMFNSCVLFFLCVNVCRARLSLRGHAEGDDQVWNEHCSHELLPWNTWGGLLHWSAVVNRSESHVCCRSRSGLQKTTVAICTVSRRFASLCIYQRSACSSLLDRTERAHVSSVCSECTESKVIKPRVLKCLNMCVRKLLSTQSCVTYHSNCEYNHTDRLDGCKY